MTIICPACDAHFRNPPADIPMSRPVQCGKCDHEWLPLSTRIKMDAPSIAPDMADLVDGQNAIKTALPVVMPKDLKNHSPKPIFVDRAPEQIHKTSISALVKMAAPMVAMACLAVFSGSIIFKDAIMAELPKTTSLYQAAGLTSKNPALEIANVVTTKSINDGISQLIVKGEVLNIADNTVPVPPLKLIMRGKSNANLFAWTVTTAKTSLKAGEKSRFTAVAHDFPIGAVNVEVEFALPAKTQTNK
ncbi:MAG: MJ0042-type zinc finger domain-containing protein [Rhizobiaceae bacterium]